MKRPKLERGFGRAPNLQHCPADSEILTVEAYLAKKWGIASSGINTTEPKIVTVAVGSNSATAKATLLDTGGTDTNWRFFTVQMTVEIVLSIPRQVFPN